MSPDGESVWEFGAGKGYLAKANAEYKKRTAELGLVDRLGRTFVFVTPRVWRRKKPSLVDWAKQKSDESEWKKVLAIDAVALEHWLEQCEVVAKDFSSEVRGIVQTGGALSVREFWEQYAFGFRPGLTEQAVLSGRQKEADDLVKQLAGGVPPVIRLQADSRDEVVAFACAAIRTADQGVKGFLEARTLILETKDAARQRLNRTGMIFLPRDAAVELAGNLSHGCPTVIPLARDEEGATRLSRPSSCDLAQALKGMGLGEEPAERLARECGRSVTILARRIPSGEVPDPPWPASRDLLGPILAGGWDDALQADRKALADLTGAWV